jgi:hypothetical protein
MERELNVSTAIFIWLRIERGRVAARAIASRRMVRVGTFDVLARSGWQFGLIRGPRLSRLFVEGRLHFVTTHDFWMKRRRAMLPDSFADFAFRSCIAYGLRLKCFA